MRSMLFVLAAGCIMSCSERQTDGNAAFDRYKEGFIEALWKQYPGYASSMGYHKYDSLLTIPDAGARNRELQFISSHLDSLGRYDSMSLDANNAIELKILRNELERVRFELTELRSFKWDPAQYNVSGQFAEMLSGTYEPLDSRLQNFGKKLKLVPQYYLAARANIQHPTREHTNLAISQNKGGLSVFGNELETHLKASGLGDSEKQAILEDAKKAKAAIEQYVAFLESYPHTTPGSFRLGKELYERKFAFDIVSGYSVSEIYERVINRKKSLHRKMYVLADRLWGTYIKTKERPVDSLEVIRRVVDQISLKHTTPALFQSEIEKQIPELISFINEKDLLYLDPKKPLVVRREPAYMAGVAGASISAPGPYDKDGKTYYNVGSIVEWPAEQSESFLREYNDYILQILNIHEAIPGHYTQLVYSNNSPSIVKSVFGNGAMVEGWAVYTELMMLENGYKNSDEMWLMYYKWNLRSTCNAILDIAVHTKDMSREEAMDLLTRQAFQQQAEAEGKWNRVTLTQVQLCSYFTGFTEIVELREAVKKREGKNFKLKDFHSRFLSYGSAPVTYIKEMMLKEENP